MFVIKRGFCSPLNPGERPAHSLPVAKVMSLMCASSKHRTRQSLALSILTPLVIHTQHSALYPGFVYFQLASCGVCHMSCPQAGWEIFKASDSGALGPFDGAETAVKGKIEGGRERVRQETPNRSLSSAFIHSPLHLGIQKSACGLIPFSFHRQFRESSFEEKYLLFG